MAAWIEMISDEDADETLTKALDFARTPHGTVDNVMRVHSLRPSTIRGVTNVTARTRQRQRAGLGGSLAA